MTDRRTSRPPRPPGPRGHWLLGSRPEIQRDMPQTLLDVCRQYGGVTRLRKSNRTRASLGRHLGDGLITLEGAEHRRHRRLMQPVMHTQRLAEQAGVMVDLARRRADGWRDRSVVELRAEMADLTLRIVCTALFGVRSDGPEAEDLLSAVHPFAGSLNVTVRRPVPIPAWVPTRANRLRRTTVGGVDDLAYRLIRDRRRAGDGGAGDMLSVLLAATGEGGGPGFSDVEVRDELMTMFLAGHETSAAALTWAFMLLGQHPGVRDRLREEIAAAVGNEPVGVADMARMPLLGQVVKETLRLYPPAWVFDRSPLRDVVLGGFLIPKGANILFSPWVVHRDPAVWEAPDEFRPERFAGDAAPPCRVYLPFGDGPRLCTRNRFAEAEIALVLATTLARVDLSRVDDAPVHPEGDATLRPKGALHMRVTRR